MCCCSPPRSRRDARPAHRGQLAGELVKRFLDAHLRAAFAAGLIEQRGQVLDVLRAEHGVDPRRLSGDALAVELGHAAADGDLQVGAFAFHLRPQADCAVHAFRRVLTHRACVHHDQIHVVVELLLFGGRHIPLAREHAGDALGIVHVHLAAQCVDLEHAPATALLPGLGGRKRALLLGHHVFVHTAYANGGRAQVTWHAPLLHRTSMERTRRPIAAFRRIG